MFERFLEGVNNCPDADCKKSLKVQTLCFGMQIPNARII